MKSRSDMTHDDALPALPEGDIGHRRNTGDGRYVYELSHSSEQMRAYARAALAARAGEPQHVAWEHEIVEPDGTRDWVLSYTREYHGTIGRSVSARPLYAAPPAPAEQPQPEPVGWMVYTQDGQSVYVTDNPSDIKPGQKALPLYTEPPPPGPLLAKSRWPKDAFKGEKE